ncbi:MAG: FAD:protein FMN transferase [Clostridia bacterium]|nr:FAD:protein FMN transferase [Clostridia bacterium]
MKKSFFALCAVAALTLFTGCADNTPEYTTLSKTYYSMDTSATLVITGKTADTGFQDKFDRLSTAVENTLNEIEKSITAHITPSLHIETSCIYEFNEAEAGATVEIDKTAYDLLTTAKSVYSATDGYYNPAVYHSAYAYCFYGLFMFMTEEALPSDEEVEKYASLSTHFGDIELSEDNGKYYAKKPEQTIEVDGETLSLKIDLGGIGKGYALDKVNSLIDEYGFEYGYFDFGSSSIAVKKHYENADYTINFLDPRSDSRGTSYLRTKVHDSFISTSGDYERYYELGGVRYCHIINPETGKPVQTGVMTATVIGGSAAEDDAYTTAIMCMGKDKALKFISEKLTDRKVAFTYNNGGEYEIYTNIPNGGYTVLNNKYKVKDVA